MPRLTDQQVLEGLATLPGWSRAGDAIRKEIAFVSFPEAVAFIVRLAFEAEAGDHHPDVALSYRRLTLSYMPPTAKAGSPDATSRVRARWSASCAGGTPAPDSW